jgi:hypothetical protein
MDHFPNFQSYIAISRVTLIFFFDLDGRIISHLWAVNRRAMSGIEVTLTRHMIRLIYRIVFSALQVTRTFLVESSSLLLEKIANLGLIVS